MSKTQLAARWLVKNNPFEKDNVGNCHGDNFNVGCGAGPDGSPDGAAVFNGKNSYVEIPDAPSLRLGSDDFSVAVWVRAEKPISSVLGDIFSKFDPEQRCGVNLQLRGSSPAYSGMSDARHVHFGIDDSYVGELVDCGKPWPSNSLVPVLIGYNGDLYAGISDADRPKDAAHVFRWGGGKQWMDCGRLGDNPGHLSVQSMLVHDGKLYAGTGVFDWVRNHADNNFTPALTHVYRYEGNTTWKDLGQVGDGVRVLCMASFQGHLYVGLDRIGSGHVFRLENDRWVDCGKLGEGKDNVENIVPLNGVLYANSHKRMYLFEGINKWVEIGNQPFDIQQIHATQVYGGKMYYGTWSQGYTLRHENDGTWSNVGRLGLPEGQTQKPINEVISLAAYNGKLYAGVLPKAQLYRYESDGHWTLMGRLVSRPEWNGEENTPAWGRVTCFCVFQGRLFVTAGASQARACDVDVEGTHGRVMAMQAGLNASYDRDIGGEWTHLAGVRQGKTLKLYLNGVQVAAAEMPAGHTFDLSTSKPMYIGFGPHNYFTGALSDFRLYKGALAKDEVAACAGLVKGN